MRNILEQKFQSHIPTNKRDNYIMDLQEFTLSSLEISEEKFGRIYSFVDFGNVNYWYERDERDAEDMALQSGDKLVIGIEKLASFLRLFSDNRRFYYGIDLRNKKSIHITKLARDNFNKSITKPIQRIKHYLEDGEEKNTTRDINEDLRGKYIYIPKCNFDVEICVDAIRFLDKYDTLCLMSSDADFDYLFEFIRRQKKRVILISSGYVMKDLKNKADLNINAQQMIQNFF